MPDRMPEKNVRIYTRQHVRMIYCRCQKKECQIRCQSICQKNMSYIYDMIHAIDVCIYNYIYTLPDGMSENYVRKVYQGADHSKKVVIAFFFLCVCVCHVSEYIVIRFQFGLVTFWWGAPSDFKHVTHTRFVIFEIRYPCHPLFPFGFLKQRLTLACAPWGCWCLHTSGLERTVNPFSKILCHMFQLLSHVSSCARCWGRNFVILSDYCYKLLLMIIEWRWDITLASKQAIPEPRTWLCKFSQIIHGISLRQGGCDSSWTMMWNSKKIEEPWAARAAIQSHQSRRVIYTVARKEPSRSIMYTYSIMRSIMHHYVPVGA